MNGCHREEAMPRGAGGGSASEMSGRSAGMDLYAQARKALSERSPFETPEEAARIPSLPVRLSAFLSRFAGENSRRKHRRSHHKAEAGEGPHGPNTTAKSIWPTMDEYFRPLTSGDIETLVPLSSIDFLLGDGPLDQCFLNPSPDIGTRGQEFDRECSASTSFQAVGSGAGTEEEENKRILAAEELGPTVSVEADTEEKPMTLISNSDANGTGLEQANDHHPLEIDTPVPVRVLENGNVDSHCKSEGEGGLPTEVEQEPLLEKGKGRGGRVSKRKLRGDQASMPRGQRVLTRSMFPQVGFVTPGRIEDSVVGGFSSGAGCRVRLFQSSDVAQLVSSTSKVIPPKRSIKKRGLSENDPEVEKLVVSHPKSGDEVRTRCHVCCISTGEETNRILSCASCHLAVHQKCYGVSEVPAGRWLCSWCSHNTSLRVKHGERLKSNLAGRLSVQDGAAKPCVLCPNSGGALKPITLAEDEHDNSVPRFCHLFCCLWMPEVHAEDPETLEPIVNIERIKESYKKLPCAVCKVKYGACILCNNASCRTSFHPLCAREAKQGLEIRRKVGSSDFELLAFCSRHSPVQDFKVPESGSHVPGTVEDRPLAKLSSGLSANGLRKSKNKMKIKKAKLKGSQLDSIVNEKRSEKVAKDQTLDKRLEQVINTENTNMTPDSSSENVTKETSTSTERNGHVGSAACGLKSKEAADSDSVGELPICSLRPTRRSKSGKCSPKLSGEDIQLLEIGVQKINCEALGDQKTEEGGVSFERIEGFDKSCCEDEECGDSKVLQATDERGHVAVLHRNPDSVSLLSEQVVGCEDNSSSLCNSRQEPCWLTLRANSYGDCGFLDDTNIKSCHSSSVHPFVHKKLIQMQKALITSHENSRLPCNDASGQIKSEPSGSSCVKEQHEQFEDTVTDSSTDPARCRQLDRARKMGILDLSPVDEIEGEILFLQNKLLESAVANKRRCDDLVYKIITGLPRELELLRKQRWDALVVNQFLCQVREAKKQGRKERRFREAQAAAAAATAAAAASSRSSSLRKDAHEEVHAENTHHEGPLRVTFTSGRAGSYSQLVPRAKETLSRLAVTKFSSDKHSEYRKDHHPFCSVCGRRDRVSNRVSVCASCKVAVHMDCYHILKNHVSPWCCELCEDFYRQYRGSVHMNIRERPDTECSLCGRLGGAFRKTTDAQWVHVTCAEWLLESTYVRGQPYPVEGMESLSKERDLHTCCFCRSKQGVCIKCSFDDCNSTFHPSCAKEANLYTNVKVIEGRIKHKAYCRAHGPDQMEKVESKSHGSEELSIIKRMRVDFEQLRILCERIIRREKLKRDLVMCSHDMLASKRDCVAFSVLYNSSFLPPDVSSCSVTTSLRGCTDDNKSWSEVMQRSDDVTVDSTLSGVRSSSHPVHLDMEIKSSDRSKSIKPYARKRTDEMPTAGKHLPDQSVSAGFWSSTDEKGRKVKCRKHTETLQKEVVMTPIEASVQNQRLPKGFAYVPVDCLAKEQLVSHEAEIHDSHS